MGNPQVRAIEYGFDECTLYPWANGSSGTFDATTQEPLEGLRSLRVTISTTTVEAKGGESVHPLDAAEMARKVEVTTQAFKCSLRAFALLTGDDLSVDASDGYGNEVQYLAAGKLSRAPFFRLVGKTHIGSGLTVLTFPKLKLSGNIGYQMEGENLIVPEFSAIAVYDPTYVRKDGVTGAAYDWFYGDGGTPARHS
jgi:hypothetical protein